MVWTYQDAQKFGKDYEQKHCNFAKTRNARLFLQELQLLIKFNIMESVNFLSSTRFFLSLIQIEFTKLFQNHSCTFEFYIFSYIFLNICTKRISYEVIRFPRMVYPKDINLFADFCTKTFSEFLQKSSQLLPSSSSSGKRP